MVNSAVDRQKANHSANNMRKTEHAEELIICFAQEQKHQCRAHGHGDMKATDLRHTECLNEAYLGGDQHQPWAEHECPKDVAWIVIAKSHATDSDFTRGSVLPRLSVVIEVLRYKVGK